MAEKLATHKSHDINDLAVYAMQSVARDLLLLVPREESGP